MLVTCSDKIGRQMAGPGIRFYEPAKSEEAAMVPTWVTAPLDDVTARLCDGCRNPYISDRVPQPSRSSRVWRRS